MYKIKYEFQMPRGMIHFSHSNHTQRKYMLHQSVQAAVN